MGAKAVEALHDCVVSKRDHGMTGMITDFSQGGINFYRYNHRIRREQKKLLV